MEVQTFPEMDTKVENKIEIFFIQINKSKLGDYISKGLICPDKFLGDEVEKDTQSRNNNFLIISDGYIDKLDDNQLLLEIILTNDEKELLKKIENNIFFLDKALPITRIKTIYCHSQKKDSKEIVDSLVSYQSGYISEKLFKTFPKSKNKLKQYSLSEIDNIEYKEYKENFLKYDKVMGMFSFIKNTNLYYVNNTGFYSNYSDNYFEFYDSKINLINIKKWIGENFYITEIGKKFINRLHSEKYIDESFIQEIIEMIEDSILKNSFIELLSDPLAKKRILKSLENKSIYYFICLLYIYGKKGSNAKDILKDNILEEIPLEKAENAFALLGLYYGYSSLRAYEEIRIEDTNYKNIQKDHNFNIKFKLDSELDYKLVESIYQYAFNNQDEKTINNFSYLNDINIKHKTIKLPTNNEFKRWYKVEKNRKNDIYYIEIKKQTWELFIDNKMEKYDIEISFGKYYLTSFIDKYYNNLLLYSKNGKPVKPYCEKNIFMQKIKEEDNKSKQNELFNVFELDKK